MKNASHHTKYVGYDIPWRIKGGINTAEFYYRAAMFFF